MHSDGLSILLGLLAATFVTSGYHKLVAPFTAALAIVRFRVVRRVRPRLGTVLGAGEMTLGVWLACGLVPVASTGLALVVLVGFFALVAAALARGERFSCACLGAGGAQLSWVSLLRNGALVAVATLALWGAAASPGAMAVPTRVLGLAIGALVVTISMTAAVLAQQRVFAVAVTRSARAPR